MEISSLKKYFLGLMSADESEALELRIIACEIEESDLFDAENDLIENYLEGKLTDEESKAFNKNFLISNERRSRVELISSLRNLNKKPETQNDKNPIFFERLIAFFKLRPIPLVFASIGLLILIGFTWQLLFTNKPSAIETEIAAINKQDLSDLDRYKDIKNLTLTSDSLRSNGSGNAISENDLTEKVLIRLILGVKSNSNDDFNVKINANGKSIQLIPQHSIGQEVRVLLPKSLLTKGEFQITLERKDEKYNYNFNVQ